MGTLPRQNIATSPDKSNRMARTLTIAAFLALAITGASASALYSTTPEVDGKVYIEGTCSKTLTGGADSITVKWSDFTESADTIAIKLCFHKDKIVDRPWVSSRTTSTRISSAGRQLSWRSS